MIRVAVSGCAGRMGATVVEAVGAAPDMEVACGIDPHGQSGAFPVFASVAEALEGAEFDVLVDFTQPSVVAGNLRAALPAGVDCVVGTTGLSNAVLEELAALAPAGTCLFYAPNFTTGAVLMMEFAKAAAPYFPEAEVMEFHHCNKKDAPSGTAVRTGRDHLRGARRARERGPRARNGDRGRRGRARRARGGRAGALHTLHGLRSQPGGRVRLARPDALHPPRLVGPRVLHAGRCCWASAAWASGRA